MGTEIREGMVRASAIEQTARFLAELDFLIEAHEQGLLSEEEFDQARARLVIASPDPEALLILDSTRFIPLD